MKIFQERPELINNQELVDYYPELMAGNLEVKQKVIEGNVPQIMYIAKQQAPTKDHYPDYLSEGLYILVRCVELIVKGSLRHHEPDPNIRGYITVRVRRHLWRYRHRDKLFSVDIETQQKLTLENKFLYSVDTAHNIAAPINTYETEQIELNDLINHTFKDKYERVICEGRMAGLDDPTIGRQLEISGSRVGQIRRGMLKKMLIALEGKRNGYRYLVDAV